MLQTPDICHRAHNVLVYPSRDKADSRTEHEELQVLPQKSFSTVREVHEEGTDAA